MNDRPRATSCRTAALAYVARRWSVVPMHSVHDGMCSCRALDCPSNGKHPRVRWDEYQARRASADQVRRWWGRWPDANVGIVTGAVSGLVVVDIDPRHGGDRTLAGLMRDTAETPAAPTCLTGGGGIHWYFESPARRSASVPLGPGVDLKADGGLVVAPPSRHASGRRYRWATGATPDERPLLPPPEWLVNAGPAAASTTRAGARRSTAPHTAKERAEFARLWSAVGVTLERGDRYYRCPFHVDVHPSLHVDEAGCRWYCFGCARGGGPVRLRALVEARTGGLPAPPEAGDAGEARAPGTRPSATASEGRGVRGTWLQWPTLQPGGEQPVVGESAHADALEELAGGRSWGGTRQRLVTAQLVREPDNPHDPDAVRVDIDGRAVGYLPRSDAPRFHTILDRLAATGHPATARARLTGGWERGPSGRGHIGVTLDADARLALLRPDCPFLPDDVAVAVTGEEEHQRVLERLVRDAPGTLLTAAIADVAHETDERDCDELAVLVAGERVGALSGPASRRYAPVVHQVQSAGLPTTCAALVTRGRRKLEVRVLLPRPEDLG